MRVFVSFLTGVQMSSGSRTLEIWKKKMRARRLHDIVWPICRRTRWLRRELIWKLMKETARTAFGSIRQNLHKHMLTSEIIWCDNMRTHPSKLYRRNTAAAACRSVAFYTSRPISYSYKLNLAGCMSSLCLFCLYCVSMVHEQKWFINWLNTLYIHPTGDCNTPKTIWCVPDFFSLSFLLMLNNCSGIFHSIYWHINASNLPLISSFTFCKKLIAIDLFLFFFRSLRKL